MREFRVNEFLSLRLEGEETTIYVRGQAFIQCAFLLLNINVNKMTDLNEIESIDEAAEKLDTSMEDETIAYKFKIPPEVEFWGHCSNLQVWYEHNYDTRLIHSNLAFPLLRKLTEAGDPLAKEVFKKEIIRRYKNGINTTREFLEAEGFLRYLTIDERLNLLLNSDDFNTFIELSEEIPPFEEEGILEDYPIIDFLSNCISSEKIKIEDRKITELNLWNLKLQEFPKSILQFKSLKTLNLRNNQLKEIPQDIDKLSSLQNLSLTNNEIVKLPDSIGNLKNLRYLSLGKNKIDCLPNNIGDLIRLKALRLSGNSLKEFPVSICKLEKLEELILYNNNLKELPECLTKLRSLKYVDLEKNCFNEYPEVLKKIENLKREIKIDFDL